MLTALSIRDIVLVDKLDISLSRGLTVLTGETGAGKSVLLDALGLALGARGDTALVRAGAAKGVVTACFQLGDDHAGLRLVEDHGIDTPGAQLVIRRIQPVSGASRALINDQPVSVQLLARLGPLLAEIHGQHDDRAMVAARNHRRLLDAYGGLDALADEVADLWTRRQSAATALAQAKQDQADAETERGFLRQAVGELCEIAPVEGEEDTLAARRQMMMRAEQFSTLLAEASAVFNDDGALQARINTTLRKLARWTDQAAGLLDEVMEAMERAAIELSEAERIAGEAQARFVFNPGELESVEHRLFSLRALARKHKVTVNDLPDVLRRFEAALTAIDDISGTADALGRELQTADQDYRVAAQGLSTARAQAAHRLDDEVMAELPALKLDRSRFVTAVETNPELAGPAGCDRVEFLISANQDVAPDALHRVASGGELARVMLALKAVLAARASAPTLIFDEIDTGVGGATAHAVGQRLARLSGTLQVLAVTHSPQVAARAGAHLLVSKSTGGGQGEMRTVTRIAELAARTRREEIARMLSGASVTEEARAQADRLLEQAG